ERRFLRKRLEDLHRQLDCYGADRHVLGADSRLVAHALGNGERLEEDAVKDTAGRAGLHRRVIERLDLPEDLRFADDHRVEARSNSEEMADGGTVLVHVEMRPQVLLAKTPVVADGSGYRTRVDTLWIAARQHL